MEITDLDLDILRRIFSLVAQSGGGNLARTMTVCRMFRELGNDRDILRSTGFGDLTMVTILGNLHLFQQFDGVLSKAARSGSATAQFLLAKIILLSSTKLVQSPFQIDDNLVGEDQSSSDSSYASDDDVSDADAAETEEGDSQASVFLSAFESAYNTQAPIKSLHHYHFVRMLWAKCSPHDISEMRLGLHCYYNYFGVHGNYDNSIFFKFIDSAEKISNFLRGIEELQSFSYGLVELDDEEEDEILDEDPDQDEQQIDFSRDFVRRCKKHGKWLWKIRNKRPDDKDLAAIIDAQFEHYKASCAALNSGFDEIRTLMLPVIDKIFCAALGIDPCPFTG
uniref:Uncharacterized protein n=2 Tax=Kalanchoe fedtschenkoi TaxID=63787 RepID=A0A7N0VFX0_KALFE